MNLNGSTESIRQLAKKTTLCDGGIEVWYLPYTPALSSLIYHKLKEHAGDDSWYNAGAVFAALESSIVDTQLLDDDNWEAKAIDTYIHTRQGNDAVGNFGQFMQLLPNTVIDMLFVAYEDTRAKLPPAPQETQESKPPETNPLEMSGLPAKKAKRGKKPIAATS